VVVEEAGSFHERLTGKLWVKRLSPDWWIYSDGFQPSRVYLWRKRLLDIVCASLMIAVTVPLLLLIAIGIRLDSPGPAIFSQERVGLHGAKFTLYKFRSMNVDAESKSGPAWAGEFDNRVTRFGRLLRRFHLDEIPQAFNVLRGDMSFAGPRPERPYFVDMLRERVPYYGLRHYVKPGITGWAQVNYPYGASVEDAIEKLQYDLYYIKHMTLRQDLLVLLKTFKVVLFGREQWSAHERLGIQV
jgi:exopolysaccharide biosynthesis polyprenyl glycosylphosphotransferase